ncbi:MAG: small mechanosensitive ion channel protein MscS [Candidatus Syntrophoarchaeum caldarius]|uniref:Small mechanosensitive ion channel protein MscS n=1 Tax=Candidatus Syntropharchaeum caldarium TaxID=1838285 RepID=A0A1F2P8S2_9EURY|nr:MAG: small mechanosensitive ion channel protein MscS [Candidatus Syntrophoarchaeum caldarius]
MGRVAFEIEPGSIITDLSNFEYIHYAIAILIILLTLSATKLTFLIFNTYLKRLAAKTATNLDDIIIKTAEKSVYIIVLLIGAYFALYYIEFPWLTQFFVLIKIISVIIGTWVSIELFRRLIKDYGHELTRKTETRIDDVIIPVAEKLGKIVIIVIGVLIILDILEIKITPMLAGLGIAGIAVALAAQETLSNMFSGVFLMLDHPVKIGERIILDSGELCEVRDIGLRSTKLYNVVEHTMIFVPNEMLAKSKIVNISAPDLRLKVQFPIGVAYGTDVRKVREVLIEIAREAPDVLNDPEPIVVFREFGDFSLNLLLILWIDDIKKKFDVIDYVNQRIDDRFKEEGIEIPFPIRTLYMPDLRERGSKKFDF